MKFILKLLFIVAVAAVGIVYLSGCANFPKNAYGEDVQVSTPWGGFSAKKLATGTAASNATKQAKETTSQK